jgi:hypothetical protein
MQHRKGWIAVSRRVFSMMEDGARLRNGDPEVVRLHLLRRHGVSAGGIDTYDYLPDLRGRTVAVPSNKICTLHWRDTEGKANVKIQLRCPPDSAGVVGCTLLFEDRGISLCRPDGSVYLASMTKDTPVTWPITHLETLDNAANIRKCWEAQMEKQWPVFVPAPISSSVASHPPGFYLLPVYPGCGYPCAGGKRTSIKCGTEQGSVHDEAPA